MLQLDLGGHAVVLVGHSDVCRRVSVPIGDLFIARGLDRHKWFVTKLGSEARPELFQKNLQ